MRRGTKRELKSQPAGTSAPALVRIVPFAVGATGIALVLFAYYSRTWYSFTTAFDVCVQPFCDFVDYYYPMGEAIFNMELPVEGFLYSPFIAILLSVFPPLGLSASLFIWGILQILSVILSLLLFRRLVLAELPIQLLFVGLTLSSFPILLNYIAGQVSVFILVTIFGLFFLYGRGHYLIAATLLAFAVSFKFYPLIFLAAFAARRDTRFLLLAVIACCVFLFVVPGVLLGVSHTFSFYGVLFNSFHDSEWVVANPQSQFFPHLILRLANAAGHDAHAYLPLLHWIAYGVAVANIVLLFLVQRARLSHANLWSILILFLTIPFVLKTSWPHDFFFLPFAQALLVWRLLGGEENAAAIYTEVKRAHSTTLLKRTSFVHVTLMFFLILPSIVFSNVFFFNLFDNFLGYGLIGFLFWADLLLLIATYVELLPPTLHGFAYRNQPLNTKNEK